ncbi:MAG: PQQ-binding-like beta-propeller repeat protein [Planctomycetales bacterium]
MDGQTLYTIAGGEGSIVIAFDKETGKELWKALSAPEPGYSSPVLIEAGGTKQLVAFDADSINGLNPATGKSFWSFPIAPNYGMAIMSPVKHGDHLFAAAIVNVGIMLKLDSEKPAATVAWKGDNRRALYPVCAAPIVEEDGTMYGVDRFGHLRGVEFKTGKRLWETTKPITGDKTQNSGTGFLVRNADRYFIFNEAGELIVAELTPSAYKEISRKKLLEPTGEAFGRPVVWSHPAYAGKCIFARNDKEIVCVSLAE